MAKFDPFLSLDCAPTPSTLAQSEERKGSNFAIWQPCEKEQDEEGSFFAGGPGAEGEEIAASSAEASPGPVKRANGDIAFGRGPEIAEELGMIWLRQFYFNFGNLFEDNIDNQIL